MIAVLPLAGLEGCGKKAELPMEYSYEAEPAADDTITVAIPEQEPVKEETTEQALQEPEADTSYAESAPDAEQPKEEPEEEPKEEQSSSNETGNSGSDVTSEPVHDPLKAEEPKPKQKNDYTVYSGGDTGDDDLNELCDDILAEIVDDDMTEREKAYAIYTWVESNIRYQGSTDTSDIIAGAIRALSTYKGDCFAFCTSSMALLTRAGFDNVIAHEDDDSHFWNMVKVDGEWWHFDTTTGWGTERFLWTTDELLDYVYSNEKYGTSIWYDWDPANGPDTP